MKSYTAIKAEIAKLEKQAEALRKTERQSVIAKLMKTIAEYELTAEDLGLGRASVKAAGRRKSTTGAKSRAAASPGAPKYRDPKTRKTWTGRGKPPAWIAGVKNRDAFLISKPAASATATAEEKSKATGKAAGKPGVAAKRAKPSKASKSVPAKKKARATRKAGRAAVRTPAVQIESGVAMS